MIEMVHQFHFLRPLWLLAFIPAALIWWRCFRGRDPRIGLADDIAPHLLDRMVTVPKDRPSIRPATMLLSLGLVSIIATAGPSYRRVPSPFAEDTSQLILVVKMAPSMLTNDLQPSRLERVRTKLHDLLESRKGAGTALIAYSGSSHLVMPATDDSSVIDHMLEALNPGIMPEKGDSLADALSLASAQLQTDGKPGSILVVADSAEESQITAITKWRQKDATSVQFLAALRDDASLERSRLLSAAQTLDAKVVRITPDDSDIERIARRADQAIVTASITDSTQWRDDGFFLVPLLALGILLWCRRGWSIEQ